MLLLVHRLALSDDGSVALAAGTADGLCIVARLRRSEAIDLAGRLPRADKPIPVEVSPGRVVMAEPIRRSRPEPLPRPAVRRVPEPSA